MALIRRSWLALAAGIVGAALYLASDASRFTNGAIIKVDGGAAFT